MRRREHVAAVLQHVHEVGADEAGRAGDEHPHRRTGRPSRSDSQAASPITSGARASSGPTTGVASRRDRGDERLPLAQVARDVALEEEVRQRRRAHTRRGAHDRGVRERILRRRHPRRAEHLDALVVAVDGLARVVDRRQAPVLVLEQDHRRVDVVRLAELGVHPYRAARVHLDDLALRDEARHVEVVDGHVEEDPARRAHVLDRRRRGIARGDADDLHLADLALGHGARHRGVRGVEAPVEADLERHAGGLDGGERAVHLGQVERDGLLAEDRLARLGGRDDQVRVRVGGRADGDGVHVRRGQQLLDAGRGHAEPPAHHARAVGVRVGDARDLRARHLPREQVGVHGADPADADHAHPHRAGRHRAHPTSSQWPDSALRSSASCTVTHCTACSKPGSNARPSATARQNS